MGPPRVHLKIGFHRSSYALSFPNTQTLMMPVAAAGRNGTAAVSPSPAARAAAEILKSGGVVATPTDTVYGIAALVQNASAVKKLYSIKGRDDAKPIAICVAEVADLGAWGEGTDDLAGVLEDLLPGSVDYSDVQRF